MDATMHYVLVCVCLFLRLYGVSRVRFSTL